MKFEFRSLVSLPLLRKRNEKKMPDMRFLVPETIQSIFDMYNDEVHHWLDEFAG